uniref:Uncharacterized protein n=1 Tax=mine drainage metagenome TaxID=410659 RepID=E6Q0Q8_9ZZZZ
MGFGVTTLGAVVERTSTRIMIMRGAALRCIELAPLRATILLLTPNTMAAHMEASVSAERCPQFPAIGRGHFGHGRWRSHQNSLQSEVANELL